MKGPGRTSADVCHHAQLTATVFRVPVHGFLPSALAVCGAWQKKSRGAWGQVAVRAGEAAGGSPGLRAGEEARGTDEHLGPVGQVEGGEEEAGRQARGGRAGNALSVPDRAGDGRSRDAVS